MPDAADIAAFRAEVRGVLDAEIPQRIRANLRAGRRPTAQDIVTCQRILNRRGWAVPQWPLEWGGTDWTPLQRQVFLDELHATPAPEPLAFNVTMVGPVIAAFGSEAQKRRFLPRIANLDDWFCQGFSEPEAGSDLASLRTTAIRDGDSYVLNGQKLWTSGAHHANWMFGLFRTDRQAAKWDGISFLLVDMKTPGITVRPVITIDGLHETNEVFFDDVRVPADNLVGREGEGWKCAKFLLANERLLNGRLSSALHGWRRLKDRLVSAVGDDAREHELARRLTWLEVEMLAMTMTQQRLLEQNAAAGSSSAIEAMASIVKIKGTEIRQGLLELAMLAAGPHALPHQAEELVGDGVGDAWVADWIATSAASHCFGRAMSIYGGANEVQRNIVARRRLELG